MLKNLWETLKILAGVSVLFLIGGTVLLMFHISGFIILCIVIGGVTLVILKG